MEVYVMKSFWVIKNPQKEKMLLDMKKFLKEPQHKQRIWHQFLQMQYPPQRNWLLAQLDDALVDSANLHFL